MKRIRAHVDQFNTIYLFLISQKVALFDLVILEAAGMLKKCVQPCSAACLRGNSRSLRLHAACIYFTTPHQRKLSSEESTLGSLYLKQRATGALVLLRCSPLSASLLGLPRAINQPRQQLPRIRCDENKTQEKSGTQQSGHVLCVLRSLRAIILSGSSVGETLTSDTILRM